MLLHPQKGAEICSPQPLPRAEQRSPDSRLLQIRSLTKLRGLRSAQSVYGEMRLEGVAGKARGRRSLLLAPVNWHLRDISRRSFKGVGKVWVLKAMSSNVALSMGLSVARNVETASRFGGGGRHGGTVMRFRPEMGVYVT